MYHLILKHPLTLSHSIITWSWEITFIPLWIVLCISLVGVLYTIIFAGILLRMPDVNQVFQMLAFFSEL